MAYDYSFSNYVRNGYAGSSLSANVSVGGSSGVVSSAAKNRLSALDTAANWNAYGSLASAGIQIASTMFGAYSQRRLARYQQRIAKAQARIQANAYAAEAVGYEQTAQRIAQAYGAQEYETLRQQESYLEDMTADAAIRGGAMEGTNTAMISAQAAEFARSNSYARLANEREQASYMNLAQQSMSNAHNSIVGGNMQARSIKASASAATTASMMNLTSGLLGTFTNYQNTKLNIGLQKQLFNLAGAY